MAEFLSGSGVGQPQFWLSAVEIIWINVLLSGDNAIVIALACRGLPQKRRLIGMVLGTGVALLLRVVFTSIVVTLMFIPYLKLAGGAALFWIALKLVSPAETASPDRLHKSSDTVLRALMVIAVADIIMSLDNVIAVAAAANGSILMLVFGLAVSIPIIVAGATLFLAIVNRFPLIIWAGAAVLGWLAGEMIATDEVVIGAVKHLGPSAQDKFALACSIVGAAGVLIGGALVARTRGAVSAYGTEL